MKIDTAQSTKLEVKKFTIDFSKTPFDLRPVHEVTLAENGRKALIYDTMVDAHDGHHNTHEPHSPRPRWRVVLCTRNDRLITNDRYEYSGVTFNDPLLMKLYLTQKAHEFAKLKKTTVETSEADE